MRFNQALINMNIVDNAVDDFYLESLVLLKRLNKWEGK